MCTAIDRLRSLKVSDVMTRDIVELSTGQGMDEAAKVFATHGISSAPVTDEFGRCIGILSASDFLHRECGSGVQELGAHILLDGDHGSPLKIAPTCDSVGTYMTDAVQSIAPDQSLLNASRVMCIEHIHHLPVIEGKCLVGMLSVMDVVAAMTNAFDEMAVETLKKEGG
jgi:CBS-domain-containing membrane protein